jgi:CBS domain containing-hemolysin-like protein
MGGLRATAMAAIRRRLQARLLDRGRADHRARCVFSLDSVITAVGMTDHRDIMIIAVTVAVLLMMLVSKPLTIFVNARPTVVMLCLGFLLMVGLSLIAEGFGHHVPKGYLYAAIGFSVLIEAFNQFAQSKLKKRVSEGPDMRQRTADAVLRVSARARATVSMKKALHTR